MNSTRNARIPGAIALAVGLVSLVGLAGCAAEAEAPGTSAPEATEGASASTPATPSPTRDPRAVAEEAQLPMPADDILEWSKTAVPGTDAEGFAGAFSGWMSEHTARHHTNTDTTAEAGSYLLQFACRGGGTITLEVRTVEGEQAAEPVVCSNSTIALDATTATTGLVTDLTLEGAPTVYALSYTDAPAAASAP